jgi:hypothetical protein
MAAGTALTDIASESRSRLQVPHTIRPTTTRLVSGSSQSQPVSRMTAAATTTPADTAASATMCRKAPRILRSPFRPEANSQAVAPLMTMPMAATIMTVPLATGSG